MTTELETAAPTPQRQTGRGAHRRLEKAVGLVPPVAPVVVGYVRVSTSAQETDGNGLESQRAHIIAAATAQGVQIDEWVVDVKSGAKAREGLESIREMARKGTVSKVFCYKLDRLARDPVMSETLWRELAGNGVRVVSATELLTDGPIGDLMRAILSAFAAFERATIAMRTQDGKKIKVRACGTYGGGGGCLGFRGVGAGVLEPVDKEIECVKRLFSLRQQNASIYKIADTLNAEGFVTRDGKPWRGAKVARILKREAFYRGLAVIHRNIAPSPDMIAHEPILERDGLMLSTVFETRTAEQATAPERHESDELHEVFARWAAGERVSAIAAALHRMGFRSPRAPESYAEQRVVALLKAQDWWSSYARLRGWDEVAAVIDVAPVYVSNPARAKGQKARWDIRADDNTFAWRVFALHTEGKRVAQIAGDLSAEFGKTITDSTVRRVLTGEGRWGRSEPHTQR